MTDDVATALFEECAREGQAALTVPGEADADRIRERLRALATEHGIRIRTSWTDGAVLVIRLDAALWQQDAATRRAKLTPHPAGWTG